VGASVTFIPALSAALHVAPLVCGMIIFAALSPPVAAFVRQIAGRIMFFRSAVLMKV
jgi:hypothetical protein